MQTTFSWAVTSGTASLQDNGLSPGLSVGIGYTYMRGNVSIPGSLGSTTQINSVYIGDTTANLVFSDPSLNFFWTTSVIDAKIQLSKTLFIITPYIGLGAAYGISNAGEACSPRSIKTQ